MSTPLPRWLALLSELRRRHVFKVLGMYAVVAWLVIQVADTAFPHQSAVSRWMVSSTSQASPQVGAP